MKIHVCITYDVEEPSHVPGSVAHSVEFDEGIHSHRLVQLARDAAEKVAVAFLAHVQADQPAATETALRAPTISKGTRVQVNLPTSDNHGAVGHIVERDNDDMGMPWRVGFDDTVRNDGDVWFAANELVPIEFASKAETVSSASSASTPPEHRALAPRAR